MKIKFEAHDGRWDVIVHEPDDPRCPPSRVGYLTYESKNDVVFCAEELAGIPTNIMIAIARGMRDIEKGRLSRTFTKEVDE